MIWANRCRTASSKVSTASSARNASTSTGSPTSKKSASSSNIGVKLITRCVPTVPSVASLPIYLPNASKTTAINPHCSTLLWPNSRREGQFSCDRIQILEIGTNKVFKTIYRDNTTCYFSSCYRQKGGDIPIFTWRILLQVFKDFFEKKYSLVAVSSLASSPWSRHESFGHNLGTLLKHLLRPSSWGTYLVVFMAHFFKVPIVAYDMVDTMLIAPANFFLFPFVRCFFKRELPQNNWHVFLRTTRRSGDISNIRRQKFFQEAMPKVHPFPFHVGPVAYSFKEVLPENKKWDIFYVGDNPKTTVRTSGVKILMQLGERGYKVHLPKKSISQEEFFQCIEESWLVWSPEGSGWECGRHYEAIVHGAVPVINYPTIHRYKPFLDRVHAFYYGCEEKHLLEVIEAALQNRNNLLSMIQCGRRHLQEWYVSPKILEYILSQIN
jgi:hypothetical protein